MRVLCTLAVLVLSCTLKVQAFQCSDACELLKPDEDTSMRYQIMTDKLTYSPGTQVHVSLAGYNASFPYHGVILQAKRMGDNMPTGSFVGGVNQPNAQMMDCARDMFTDTVCIMSDSPLDMISATWSPPEPAGTAHHVEFQALFLDLDDNVHRQHSVTLTEEVTDEVEERDPHDDTDEAELVIILKQHNQDLIDQENLATEDEMARDEERERQEHDQEIRWEEMEYEREQKADEDERRARIQAEIRDKEEYDRIQFEMEERAREAREREEAERREREREEAERKRKEDEERDRNRTFEEGQEEIDINDKDGEDGKPKTGGSSRNIAMSTVSLLLVSLLVAYL